MNLNELTNELFSKNLSREIRADHDFFAIIRELVRLRDEHTKRSQAYLYYQKKIAEVYDEIMTEVRENDSQPANAVSFGTSGWRGIIGKDIFAGSVAAVTHAIVDMYHEADTEPGLAAALGVQSLAEARERGCVLGYDNRFANDFFASIIKDILTSEGFAVRYAGEATTGTLSAAVLRSGAAFSINLTPSHNPLDYGGFKFNAADAGPAAPTVTDRITRNAARRLGRPLPAPVPRPELVRDYDALAAWRELVRDNGALHGLDYDTIIDRFAAHDRLTVAVDCVHGASRIHVRELFKGFKDQRLVLLRKDEDPTFGGIAPEPSTDNLALVNQSLAEADTPLRLGVIMDPDADRIRFTDGRVEITMNQFGAMAYHFLHEVKGRAGLVAKTVATSNFANAIAAALGEEVFETRVGFKEFKPVIGKALVCFEESDGITVIGHTPEKDAYIGLLLALDMIMTLDQNLGDYLDDLRNKYGSYYPDKDGIVVSRRGDALNETLKQLDRYREGDTLDIGGSPRIIKRVITVDGYKFILDDDSWLMIRPSGTEPKVRFYVEARGKEARGALFAQARAMLAGIGLL